MTTVQPEPILRHLHKLAVSHDRQEWSDRQLLDEFAARGEEAAFRILVARHGPMVLRVCRRVLGHEQDAEDAFQATFLVLARTPESIRKRAALADWLHGVAYRTAMKAKRSAARRRAREERLRTVSPESSSARLTWDEVQTALDEELLKLPEAFRAAFVLCILEGKSGPQAAAVLGCKEGTVSSRLTRARQQLQRRLTRRGINLGALLGALTIAEGASPAAASALIQTTVRHAAMTAAGSAVAGHVPAHLVALANGVTSAMSPKVKVAMAVLFAACLVAGTLTYRAFAAASRDQPPREAADASQTAQQPAPKKDVRTPRDLTEEKDTVTYAGRVVGPNGQPVTGAKVFYYFITREDEPNPVRATTDAEGRFSFTLTRKDVPLSADAIHADPLRTGPIVVKADGFTFAWAAARKDRSDLALHLSTDAAPLEGRIVDLEGKPISGLRISALSVAAPESGDLSAFVKALESKESLYVALFKHLPNHLCNPLIGRSLAGFLPATKTDADGRFRLSGFAEERLVELRVEGPAIETQNLYVVTRSKPLGSPRVLTPIRVKDPFFAPDPPVHVFWNGFDHAVAPGQTVIGTVRDAGSGQPIPRAIVESYSLAGTNLGQNTIYATIADDAGRYQFTGLPRGKGNRIRIRPPQDHAYIPLVKDVPASETFAKATVDASLAPGVCVDVKVTDKNTGKPVPGYISYFVLPEKWDAESRFSNPYSDAYNNFSAVRNDGAYRFVAVPAKAVVAFRADWDKYPIAREASTIRLPGGMSPSNFQAFAEIHPKLGGEPVKVAFTLNAERIVKGTLYDPDGRPLSGALAGGLRHDWFSDDSQTLRTAEFAALGVDPSRPRLLCFAHPDKKLAGSTVVRGNEQAPVTVRLQPWATVSGRLLDADGKPITKASLAFIAVPMTKPDQPRRLDTGLHVIERSAYKPSQAPRTGAQGRFRVEGLIPGLKYNLALPRTGPVDSTELRWSGLAFSNLVLRPGETRDLGDVTLQPFPKE